MPVTKVLLDETVDTSITWTKMSENLPPNNSEQKKVEVFFFIWFDARAHVVQVGLELIL